MQRMLTFLLLLYVQCACALRLVERTVIRRQALKSMAFPLVATLMPSTALAASTNMQPRLSDASDGLVTSSIDPAQVASLSSRMALARSGLMTQQEVDGLIDDLRESHRDEQFRSFAAVPFVYLGLYSLVSK